MADPQPIPPSVTSWVDILKAEKALLDYVRLAQEKSEGIAVLSAEAAHEKALEVLQKAGEVVTHMPNLIGPAKLVHEMIDLLISIEESCRGKGLQQDIVDMIREFRKQKLNLT